MCAYCLILSYFVLFLVFWGVLILEEDKATLLSLVKKFDSLLAAYEGFCNLKQVNFLYNFNFYVW